MEAVTVPMAAASYHYNDINIVSPDSIVHHLKVSPSLPLFQMHPHLKHIIRAAVTHTIKELIG